MWSVCINRHSPSSPFTFNDLLGVQDRVRQAGEPTLIFAEVAPTVTLGNRQDPSAFEPLRAQGLDVMRGERGGLETWHGPGQWVGFVVCPIERLTGDARGVRKAVHVILDAVLRVVREWEPAARIEEGDRLGIWSARGKLVSIGIRVREGWVTSGFALNVIPTPTSFSHIHPCGLSDSTPDFLLAGRAPEPEWGAIFESLPAQLHQSFLSA
jgi:lipoate-protein ligase B